MKTKLVTQGEFDTLLEYSISNPTGTTIGKTWKRHNYVFKVGNGTFNAGYLPSNVELVEERWFHCEYILSVKKGYIAVETKFLEIVGALEIDKVIHTFMQRR